jgi:hypothetical protein
MVCCILLITFSADQQKPILDINNLKTPTAMHDIIAHG